MDKKYYEIHCRTCFASKIPLNPLVEENFLTILKDCASVNLSDKSDKTFMICANCREVLQLIDKFRLKCSQVNEYFHSLEHDNYQSDFKPEIKHTNFKIEKFEGSIEWVYCKDPLDVCIDDGDADFDQNCDFEKIEPIKKDCENYEIYDKFSNKLFKSKESKLLLKKRKLKVKKVTGIKKIKKKSKNNVDGKININQGVEIPNEFQCLKCPNRYFKSNESLYRHSRIHNIQPFAKCPFCFIEFHTFQTLTDHFDSQHSNLTREIDCKMCVEKFYMIEQLNHHLMVEHRPLDNVCPHCGITSVKMKRHLKNKHSTPMLVKCPICGKELKNEASLKDHMERHERNQKNDKSICNICGMKFWNVGLHVKKMHETDASEKKITCKLCGMKFDQLKEVIAHQKEQHPERHNREPKVECKMCGKKFLSAGHLHHHKKSFHNHIRPFHCSICAKSFKLQKHLALHMRTHTDERPYACDLCDRKFRHQCTLKTHRLIHTGEKPFKCDLCGREFRQRVAMRTHIKFVHNKKRK